MKTGKEASVVVLGILSIAALFPLPLCGQGLGFPTTGYDNAAASPNATSSNSGFGNQQTDLSNGFGVPAASPATANPAMSGPGFNTNPNFASAGSSPNNFAGSSNGGGPGYGAPPHQLPRNGDPGQKPVLPNNRNSVSTGNLNTANIVQEPSQQELKENPELLRSVASAEHPFARYLEPPTNSDAQIKGASYSVAQLLEGVRSPASRKQLLQAYWTLAGLLAEHNFRFEVEQYLYGRYSESGNSNYLLGNVHLAQQQRKATEIAFIKKQYQLAELVARVKGKPFTQENLPIPCDYPIFKKYETHVDKIARSERSKYLGRMIPLQEQLIDAKFKARKASDNLFQTASGNSGAMAELVSSLNQRTEVYLELVQAIVDYNSIIAEYTSETVGTGISQYRLVGALIELPKYMPRSSHSPETMQPSQLATPRPNTFSGIPAGSQPLPPAAPNTPPAPAFEAPPAPPVAGNYGGFHRNEEQLPNHPSPIMQASAIMESPLNQGDSQGYSDEPAPAMPTFKDDLQ